MSVFVIISDKLWYIQHSNHSAQYCYIDWWINSSVNVWLENLISESGFWAIISIRFLACPSAVSLALAIFQLQTALHWQLCF